MSKQERDTESDLVVISQMAEKDESRTDSYLNYNESGSNCKDEEGSSWLQLSIGSCSQTPTTTASSSHQHPPPTAHHNINWPFSPHTITMGLPSSSSSSSSLRSLPLGCYFQFPAATAVPGFVVSGPNSRVRVVDLPRTPGIWFMLQASHNQFKEPFLPQIPKSYLRIKDGRMTVRLVIKYLVNKLRLESDSEVRTMIYISKNKINY